MEDGITLINWSDYLDRTRTQGLEDAFAVLRKRYVDVKINTWDWVGDEYRERVTVYFTVTGWTMDSAEDFKVFDYDRAKRNYQDYIQRVLSNFMSNAPFSVTVE